MQVYRWHSALQSVNSQDRWGGVHSLGRDQQQEVKSRRWKEKSVTRKEAKVHVLLPMQAIRQCYEGMIFLYINWGTVRCEDCHERPSCIYTGNSCIHMCQVVNSMQACVFALKMHQGGAGPGCHKVAPPMKKSSLQNGQDDRNAVEMHPYQPHSSTISSWVAQAREDGAPGVL